MESTVSTSSLIITRDLQAPVSTGVYLLFCSLIQHTSWGVCSVLGNSRKQPALPSKALQNQLHCQLCSASSLSLPPNPAPLAFDTTSLERSFPNKGLTMKFLGLPLPTSCASNGSLLTAVLVSVPLAQGAYVQPPAPSHLTTCSSIALTYLCTY